MFIVDNLSGQTTEQFRLELKKHKAKRHLLPTGVTDELQLIDDGVGVAVKNEMGNLFDLWAMEYDHLERWVADGQPPDAERGGGPQPMAMWEKRVLITRLAAQAWENVCSRFDFEKASTRLGMRMTVDGSGDDKIKIQGMADYCFTDADGGEQGDMSDEGDDPADAAEREADVDGEWDGTDNFEHGATDDGEQHQGDIDECYDGGTDESDGDESTEDDTFDPTVVRTTIGNAVAPAGMKFVEQCPPVQSLLDRQALLGKQVFVGWDSNDIHGWFVGTVHSTTISARDRQKTPSANFVVKYTKQRTANKLNGCVACELSERVYGANKWWVLLEKSAS